MAEKKINGRTFKTAPMLATEAIVLQARLLKAAGPAVERLGEIFAGMGKDATDEVKNRANGAAIGAFVEIFARNDPRELAGLLKDIVQTAQIQRPSGYSDVDFDGDFSGDDLGDVIPVVVWALREQFGPFFSGLLGNGSLAKAVRG